MMKKDNIFKTNYGLKLVLLLVPFFLGIIGFKMERVGYSYLDAAYASMQMYFANIPLDWEYNIYIEIGRWLAPFCAVFLGISLVMDLLRGILWPIFWARLPNHYVVYGDDSQINYLCKEQVSMFSKYCVLNNGRFVNCRRYILLFDSDKKNLDFYTSFLVPRIKNKNVKVYMNILEIEPQDIQAENLSTFQLNEYMAISFFKNPQWIDFERKLISQKAGHAVKIGIIGFGDLGKRMLQSGLVMNIVSEKQKIEYHVWGDTDSYRRKHAGLNDQNLAPDKVVFYQDDVNGYLQFLEDFDVIFLCGCQEENLLILSDLLRLTAFVGKGGRIYSYVENDEILKLLQIKHIGVKQKMKETEKTFLFNERLFPISMPDQEKFLEKVISKDLSLYKRAEKKHMAYITDARKKETLKSFPEYTYFEWSELNSYLRWENMSSANYDDIRIMLREEGVSERHLAEFEHMRWLRTHYLDNWEYSAQRDDSVHHHPDLQKFDALPEEEKEKDNNF